VRAALARHPDLALARILPYGVLDGDIEGRFLGIRGAGADFSFFTRSNDYGQQPDIHLDQTLSAGPYGGTVGFLVDVGEVDLMEIAGSQKSSPLQAVSGGREMWDLLWTDAHTTGREFDRSFVDRANGLNLTHRAAPGVGHTYLVRSILPGEHDILAAFEILSADEYGYTLAWSLLHSWPISGGSVARPVPGAGERIDRLRGFVPPPVPAWLTQLDVPGLMDLSHRIRSESDPKLFPKRPDLEQTYATILSGPDAGIARMLHRGRFDSIVDGRERGAYYSFATRSSDFDGEQDLAFEQDHFRRGAAEGFLMDLGAVGIEQVVSWGEPGPSGMDKPRQRSWNLLWSLRHAENTSPDQRGRALDEEGQRLVQEASLERSVPAVLKHTYVLRSIQPQKHDLLVVFTVVETDEHGLWIVWRKLRSW
jgi:hypothetical protein